MRRALALALASLFLFSGVALASTSSGTASRGSPYVVNFTTTSVGTVSVEATWAAKPRVTYWFSLRHLTDPTDVYSYDQICVVSAGYGQPAGDYSCSFSDAPTGYWRADFTPDSGKTAVTFSITP